MNRIFISHMHGDHIFGIGAVMCLLGMSRADDTRAHMQGGSGGLGDVVDIYGPEGA